MKAALAAALGLACGAVGLHTAIMANENHALGSDNQETAAANRDRRLALDVLDADALAAELELHRAAWQPVVEPEAQVVTPVEVPVEVPVVGLEGGLN